MGTDKASLRLSPSDPDTLAERTGRLASAVAAIALEVGPGRSSLPAVSEDPPGAGPLAAVAAGFQALVGRGWGGPVLVVATDLPHLSEPLLRWLAGYPSESSVVPVRDGRVQPLCARYSREDLETAARLVAGGRRAMRDLLEATTPLLVPEDVWADAGRGGAAAIDDVDTPEDLARARLAAPRPGEERRR
jgi:molybdopterin-guanine dinucleotide biosynthesis protein A